jgi:hypothetical protein
MNCAVNLPNWGLYFLQQQNIHKKLLKTIDLTQTIVDASAQELDNDENSTEKTVAGIKIIEPVTIDVNAQV